MKVLRSSLYLQGTGSLKRRANTTILELPGILDHIRVWSVPSIAIIRRLPGVAEVVTDKLVTIREMEDAIDVFFRDEISESEKPLVATELTMYFSRVMDIDPDEHILASLVMTAPISRLHVIINSHERYLPEDHDGPDNASRDTPDQALSSGHPSQPVSTEDYGEHGENHNDREGTEQLNQEIESAGSQSEDDETLSSAPFNPGMDHGQTLRDLVPSHQATVERIAQIASEFAITQSLVARNPVIVREVPQPARDSQSVEAHATPRSYEPGPSRNHRSEAISVPPQNEIRQPTSVDTRGTGDSCADDSDSVSGSVGDEDTPIQAQGAGPFDGLSLPFRPGNIHARNNRSSSTSQGDPLNVPGRPQRTTYSTSRARGVYSSHSLHRRTDHGPADSSSASAATVRYREIGFRGELFVR